MKTLFLLLLVLAVPCYGQNPDRDTLKGIKQFRVLIEELPASATKLGLTQEQLQTDVELRLRKAGISVAEKRTFLDSYLYVQVYVMDSTCGPIFAVDVEFHQSVTLLNNDTIHASTWSQGSMGSSGKDPRYIRDVVGDRVDQFINDFLAANPH